MDCQSTPRLILEGTYFGMCDVYGLWVFDGVRILHPFDANDQGKSRPLGRPHYVGEHFDALWDMLHDGAGATGPAHVS